MMMMMILKKQASRSSIQILNINLFNKNVNNHRKVVRIFATINSSCAVMRQYLLSKVCLNNKLELKIFHSVLPSDNKILAQKTSLLRTIHEKPVFYFFCR